MQNGGIRNVNIMEIKPIVTPRELKERFPLSGKARTTVLEGREQVKAILSGKDLRWLVIVGPCSIHDPNAGLEYAEKLAVLAAEFKDRLCIVMRSYFEKPRTSVGWKGLIHDPHLNGTYDMQTGLYRARRFLLELAELGVWAATEFVDVATPQYIDDLITWAAIGARTAESQPHRQLASGLTPPVGFKNGTGGTKHSKQLAVNGIVAARNVHGFLAPDDEGRNSQVVTKGNPWCHLVLRGGERGPNYKADSVAEAIQLLDAAGISHGLLIDCSHDNSGKDHRKQRVVLEDVLGQRLAGNQRIIGVMMESHLKAGNQKFSAGIDLSRLEYGVSITDACIGWEETESLLRWAHAQLAA